MSAERFTNTVENYIKYRPSYPKEVLSILINNCHLNTDKIIADIGSGTGLLTELFLTYGNRVFAVEPNEAMRHAAEILLARYTHFYSIKGSAEETNLPNHSVNMITAGTAFHWFNAVKSKIEFKRILKPPGYVVLIWNVRDKEKSKLVYDYEKLLLKYCKAYASTAAHKFNQTAVKEFFSPFEMKENSIQNVQQFNFAGLKGRLLSSSFSLREGDEDYKKMLNELKEIFDCHERNGKVDFLYKTALYYGQLC